MPLITPALQDAKDAVYQWQLVLDAIETVQQFVVLHEDLAHVLHALQSALLILELGGQAAEAHAIHKVRDAVSTAEPHSEIAKLLRPVEVYLCRRVVTRAHTLVVFSGHPVCEHARDAFTNVCQTLFGCALSVTLQSPLLNAYRKSFGSGALFSSKSEQFGQEERAQTAVPEETS